MRAQLIPVDGGHPIEVVKDMVLVGQKEDCDLNRSGVARTQQR
jgi:hypothetical protein